MQKLAAEAELKALRAQINPHFLFNALTTIGYLIEAAPPRALETLLRLTGLLRGVLRSDGEFTTLGREIELDRALSGHRARPIRGAAARATSTCPHELCSVSHPIAGRPAAG